jgi:hypothetical protein
MPRLTLDISMSLDGFIAGPSQKLDDPLGTGGEQLHEWVVAARAWREAHGMEGDEPPFHHPVFVLTHHAREPVQKEGGTTFTFVTDGIESALEQAREAAGDRDVAVAGGADVVQQYLEAGLIDDSPRALECTRVIESPTGAAHLQYRAAG